MLTKISTDLVLFFFKLHSRLTLLILLLTLFSSGFLSEYLLWLPFYIPVVWFLFHGLISCPAASLPQSSLVFSNGGSVRVTSWHYLPHCLHKTHPSLWGLGATSLRPYAFVTPLLADRATLSCWVLVVQDHLSCFDLPLELPAACRWLQILCLHCPDPGFSSPHPSARPGFLQPTITLLFSSSCRCFLIVFLTGPQTWAVL